MLAEFSVNTYTIFTQKTNINEYMCLCNKSYRKNRNLVFTKLTCTLTMLLDYIIDFIFIRCTREQATRY